MGKGSSKSKNITSSTTSVEANTTIGDIGISGADAIALLDVVSASNAIIAREVARASAPGTSFNVTDDTASPEAAASVSPLVIGAVAIVGVLAVTGAWRRFAR